MSRPGFRENRSIFMRPNERTNLMVLPWMHFDLLKNGVFDHDYARTLAGIFNIAGPMANLKKVADLESQFSQAQMVVAQLIKQSRSLDATEGQQIATALQSADQFLAKQTKSDIARVIAYVDRCIASGRASRVDATSDPEVTR